MPRQTLILFAFIFACLSLFAQKRALIVAIGNYDYEKTGWKKINSGNDVPLIKSVLLAQEFGKENILILQDEKATKAGIKAAFEKLIAETQAGDIVVFHFSGHGQQIFDADIDEISRKDETDGYDEALVPYDAPAVYGKNGYAGENHIRDDELGYWLMQLRYKAGKQGQVLAIIDACHSGTATRGQGTHRGTDIAFQPKGYKAPGGIDPGVFGINIKENNAAPLVCFFGSESFKVNYETQDDDGKPVGSLTYCFAKAMSNVASNSSSPATYRALFDLIKTEMSAKVPNQNPQREGDLDFEIFGNKFKGKPEYFLVTQWSSNGTVMLNGGTMHGLNVNSVVGFYEVDTREFQNATPRTTGTVVSASALSCKVQFEKNLDEKTAKNSWIYITQQNYGDMAVSVKADFINTALRDTFVARLKKFPFITLSKTSFDLHFSEEKTKTGYKFSIFTSDDYPVVKDTVYKDARAFADFLAAQARQAAQAKFLRNMKMDDFFLRGDLEIIYHTNCEADDFGHVHKQRPTAGSGRDVSGNYVFEIGDCFNLKVVNHSNRSIYYAILDIQPDNFIALLTPGNPSDYTLNKKDTVLLHFDYLLHGPAGNDVLKLIITDKPLTNIEKILSRTATRGPGGNKTPFEVLLDDTYKDGEETMTRSTPSVPPSSGAIISIPYKIISPNKP